jgi:hypothetical protein
MAFTIYHSTDTGAPALTNVTGTLITVLNDILVTGYGSQSPAGWTAPAALQGTNHWAFKNASPASPTGTGTGFYLDVNDNGPGAGAGVEARITGYETMSGVGAGEGQFPSAILSQGVSPYGFTVARKSANSSSHAWIAFADSLTLYFFVQSEGTSQYAGWAFGDFYSFAGTTDNWRCLIIGRSAENNASLGCGAMDQTSQLSTTTVSQANAVNTHYCPRTSSGGGLSIALGKHGDYGKAGQGGFSTSDQILGQLGIQTPNGPDGAYYVSPIWLHEPAGLAIRGTMRGLWQLCHPVGSFTDQQTITASGSLSGKVFQVVKTTDGGGCLAVETSNTLLTN